MVITKSDDRADVDSEFAPNAGRQPIRLALCKRHETTFYTLDATHDEVRDHMRGFGTKDPGFFYGLLAQIVNAGSKGNDPR